MGNAKLRIVVNYLPGYGGPAEWQVKVVFDNRLLAEQKCSNERLVGRYEERFEREWMSKPIEELHKAAASAPLASRVCAHCGGDTLDGCINTLEKNFCYACKPHIDAYKQAYLAERRKS